MIICETSIGQNNIVIEKEYPRIELKNTSTNEWSYGIIRFQNTESLNSPYFDLSYSKSQSGSNSGNSMFTMKKSNSNGFINYLYFHENNNIYFNRNKNSSENYGDVVVYNGKFGVGSLLNPETSLHVRNGTIKLSGGSSLSQEDARFVIDTEGSYGHIPMIVRNNTNGVIFRLNGHGSLSLGTENIGNYRLAVAGKIRAEEVKVETGWADFVFEEDYPLIPLRELGDYIRVNKHLPEIPTASEVEENGIELGNMNKLLLQKIEELTLYTIEQEQKIESLESKNKQIIEKHEKEISSIKEELLEIKNLLKEN